ncbi:MAG: flagellar hook-associated protein FlgL [Thermodesulfobacteriota bacterium]
MRVTNNMMFNSLRDGMASAGERLLKVHQMLSTGKRITRPSDDPVAMTISAGYKNVLNGLEQYERNIEFTGDYLANADTALSSVNDTLVRLKELSVLTRNETMDAQTRFYASYEVQGLLDHLISIGNTKVGDVYLFSGFLTDTETFDAAGTYNGDSNESKVFINKGTTFTYGLTGDRIFKGVGVPGGVDILQSVSDFKVALETNDITTIGNTIGLIDRAMGQISGVTADLGGRINRLQSSKEHIQGFSLTIKEMISNMEDADFADISTRLVKEQTNLEALQLTGAKFTGLSIFSFLR